MEVDTGEDESIYGKKPEIDAAFDPDGINAYEADNEYNEYFYYPLIDHSDQYSTSNLGDSEETITFDSFGNLGFYTALNAQTYQILSRTDNTMSIRNVGSEGNSWYSILTTDEQLSTVEQEKLSVSLYPNPVNQNYVTISTDYIGEKIIKIYDLNGRKLLDSKTAQNNIYVGNLTNGVYLINISVNGSFKIIKLVVNK
jgi:hypothetical protein